MIIDFCLNPTDGEVQEISNEELSDSEAPEINRETSPSEESVVLPAPIVVWFPVVVVLNSIAGLIQAPATIIGIWKASLIGDLIFIIGTSGGFWIVWRIIRRNSWTTRIVSPLVAVFLNLLVYSMAWAFTGTQILEQQLPSVQWIIESVWTVGWPGILGSGVAAGIVATILAKKKNPEGNSVQASP